MLRTTPRARSDRKACYRGASWSFSLIQVMRSLAPKVKLESFAFSPIFAKLSASERIAPRGRQDLIIVKIPLRVGRIIGIQLLRPQRRFLLSPNGIVPDVSLSFRLKAPMGNSRLRLPLFHCGDFRDGRP